MPYFTPRYQGALKKSLDQYITSFSEIVDFYDYFIFDIAGVMHDGHHFFPKAIAAVNKLIRDEKQVIFLSNTPRPWYSQKQKLFDAGISPTFHLTTSGDAARDIIMTQHYGKKIFHIGQTRNEDLFHEMDIHLSETIERADLIVLSLFQEAAEDETELRPLLKEAADSGKPILCTNPDMAAPTKDGWRKTAGYFAHQIEEMGGKVTYIGKPNLNIYDFLDRWLPEISHIKNRTLMIGDTLETDIKGADAYDVDSLLMLTGLTQKRLAHENDTPQVYIERYCKAHNLPAPTYILEEF